MKKLRGRERRHRKIRKKAFGTDYRPRLVLYRSLKNISAQLVDDTTHKTIISISTNSPGLRKESPYGGNVKAAAQLGNELAKKSLDKGITNVVFDRSGYVYHGRVKAVAEAAIKGGLSFKKKGAKVEGK